ncbi:MAG: hypothetical protein ACI9AX_002710 [Polaromonas sp.]
MARDKLVGKNPIANRKLACAGLGWQAQAHRSSGAERMKRRAGNAGQAVWRQAWVEIIGLGLELRGPAEILEHDIGQWGCP